MALRKLIYSIFLFLFILPFPLIAENPNTDPYARLTPEQIAKHPTDKWFTAERPDYREIDERVRNLAKNEESPQAVARIVCEGLTSDIEKARAIFDWLAYNVAYDTSYRTYLPSDVFKKRKAVCQGYSDLFCIMAKEVGLKARTVPGFARTNSGHAWNIVTLSDREILIDSCWGAGYVNGSRFTFRFAPWYFDTHPGAFALTHMPNDDIMEEMLIYPPMKISRNKFFGLPKLDTDKYYPYGNKDPVEDYRHRFCNDDKNLPVTYTTPLNVLKTFEYISTGDSLLDGFFMQEVEVSISDLEKYFSEEELKTVRRNKCQLGSQAAASDVPLLIIARYCNALSKKYGFEECYSILANEKSEEVDETIETVIKASGYEIRCDYKKCGFRLPTKEEWLSACGRICLDLTSPVEDFAARVWYSDNSGGRIWVSGHNYCGTGKLIYDMAGNVSELCWDSQNTKYVFMGGNIYSTREEIVSLEPEAFDNYEKHKGAHGFRLVIGTPKTAELQYKIADLYADSTYSLLCMSNKNHQEWLNLAAENGSIYAMGEVAQNYYNLGTQEGYEKCYQLCLELAESEYHWALFILGTMYSTGKYVTTDDRKAFEYFERSANAKNLSAMIKTANYFKEGKVVEKDDQKYFYWINRAVKGGYDDEEVWMSLANCYKYGIGCEKDEIQAYEIYRDLAERKNASMLALVECGDCYADGIGVRQNYYSAVRCYEKALEKGSIYAKSKLAEFYFYGRGKTSDIETAVKMAAEIVEAGFTDYGYKEKYDLYSAYLDGMNYFDDQCQNLIADIKGDSFTEYIKAMIKISSAASAIQNADMTNSALLRGLSLENLNTKVIEPMQKIIQGELLSGKTLVIINPYKGKKFAGLQKLIFSSDSFNGKKYQVNGEYYRYDKSLYEYYDNLIILQKEEADLNCIDTAFNKMKPSLLGSSQVDLMLFSTDYFSQDSDYVFIYKEIATRMIENGSRPRIMVFGSKTDLVQQNINRVFSGDDAQYLDKINVFGTPYNMQNQLACGFRNDKLFIVMLTEQISSRHLLIYLDETGWAPQPTRQDVSFLQSQQNLSKMAGIGLNKSGTITKAGKMVMHYKAVK